MAGVGFLQSLGKADLGGRLALLGSYGKCVFAHSVHEVECAREVRAARESSFSIRLRRSRRRCRTVRPFSPFISADIRTPFFSADVLDEVGACRLAFTDGRRKKWRGMSLVWRTSGKWASQRVQCGSGDEASSEDEGVSSNGSREGNVGNDALHVIGLRGPGDKISLFLEGLGAGKGGIELPHGRGDAVPGNA